MRNDAIIDRKQVICRNASLIGYSHCTVRFGDIVIYKNGDFDRMIGRVAGRIKYAPGFDDTPTIRNWLLVIALGSDLTFGMERWINPDDVIQAYDPNNPERYKSVVEFISSFFSPDWKKHSVQDLRAYCEYGSNTPEDYKKTEHYIRNHAKPQ